MILNEEHGESGGCSQEKQTAIRSKYGPISTSYGEILRGKKSATAPRVARESVRLERESVAQVRNSEHENRCHTTNLNATALVTTLESNRAKSTLWTNVTRVGSPLK